TGSLCGHFTSTAEVKFDDSQTRLPHGAISPRIDMQPSVAPQPVTVTASQQQSDRINKAGKVTDEDLHELLGGNYGKPFKILTKGSDGGSGGSIAGSFGTRGAMFEDHSKLPSRRNTSRRYNNGIRAAFTRDAKFDDRT
ncbi:hypothetical protein, partial [Streptomyces eurythermus]|uniref:hypothetical protein n=1 Tax=Streptomyces eurythermus TaxID=42237 RepID=UPI0033FA66C8